MLNKPLKLNDAVTLKNRLVMSPSTTWASNDDHIVVDQEITFHGERSKAVAMYITGCAHVLENGIGFDHEFGAYDDRFVPGLTKLAQTIKGNGAVAILQLNHAGNKAFPDLIEGGEVVSASAVKTDDSDFAAGLIPRKLTSIEIDQVIDSFAQATRRAIEAGFDGVELHGAHGFLIQNFLSPHFNQRTDEWGGSLANRKRFALAVYQATRQMADQLGKPNFVIGMRLTPQESHYEDGLRYADVKSLADDLVNAGITYLHLSLGSAISDRALDSDQTIVSEMAAVINHRVPLVAAGQLSTAQ